MPKFLEITETINNPKHGTTQITWKDNLKTITLPNGKKIVTEFISDDERITIFHNGYQFKVTREAGKKAVVFDIIKNTIVSCTGECPGQSQNNKVRICNWCSNCGACIDFCPEDKFYDDGTGMIRVLTPCSGCGTCIEECPGNAMEWV